MNEQSYNTRKELFIVAQRMHGYRNKQKWHDMLARKSPDSLPAKALKANIPEITAPKSLVLEICYPENDYDSPIDHCFPDQPGVLVKEVCIETGKVFGRIRLSLEEAKKLRALLVENLGE